MDVCTYLIQMIIKMKLIKKVCQIINKKFLKLRLMMTIKIKQIKILLKNQNNKKKLKRKNRKKRKIYKIYTILEDFDQFTKNKKNKSKAQNLVKKHLIDYQVKLKI